MRVDDQHDRDSREAKLDRARAALGAAVAQEALEARELPAAAIAPAGLAARARALAEPWLPIARKAATVAFSLALLAAIGAGFVRLEGVFGLSLATASGRAGAVEKRAEAAHGRATRASMVGPPTRAEPAATTTPDAGPSAWTPDKKLVLNRATEADLRSLPGVGATRAAAILALRAKLGRFRSVDELRAVRGLGKRGLARLAPLVVVDGGTGGAARAIPR